MNFHAQNVIISKISGGAFLKSTISDFKVNSVIVCKSMSWIDSCGQKFRKSYGLRDMDCNIKGNCNINVVNLKFLEVCAIQKYFSYDAEMFNSTA